MSILDALGSWLDRIATPDAREVSLASGESVRLDQVPVRISEGPGALEIGLGDVRLALVPDSPLVDAGEGGGPDLVLIDLELLDKGIYPFARIRPGEQLELDPENRALQSLFARPDVALRHRLWIRNEGRAVLLRERQVERETVVRLLATDRGDFLERARLEALNLVRDGFGGPIRALVPDAGIAVIEEVVQLLEEDPYLLPDPEGRPGALLRLPDDVVPVFVGDLHGRAENLLTILTRNGFARGIERGEAALLLLGDVVHPEDGDPLEDMSGSILTMDLFLLMKRRFPRAVHMLLGNHDSFAPESTKAGVLQGPLWERALLRERGSRYRDLMGKLYERLPILAYSGNYCTCHGGPPRTRVEAGSLISLRQHPRLIHEITWNRPVTRARPNGFTSRDVAQLRAALGLPRDATLVTAHNPLSADATVWTDVNNTRGHHLVYSARPDQVGVMIRVGREVVPLTYPTDPLSAFESASACAPANSRGRPPNASRT